MLARALVVGVPVTLLVVLGAAALAAPAHEALMDLGWLERHAPGVDDDRAFLKVFRRLLLLPLLLAFLLFARPLKRGDLDVYGLRGPDARVAPAFVAAGLALLALVCVIAVQFLAGWMHWESPPRYGTFGTRLLRMVPGGVLIAVIEEFIFRGWLLRELRGRLGLIHAAIACSLVYGFAHAFRPSNLTLGVEHDFTGALSALGTWLGFMFDVEAFGPAFLGLFLFGLLLTAVFLRTRTLWASVGVHAAAVWVLYTYGALTERIPERNWAGTKRLYDGPIVWVVLIVAAWLCWPRRQSAEMDSTA